MLSRVCNAFSFFAAPVLKVTDLRQCFQYNNDTCVLTYSAKKYLHALDGYINSTGAFLMAHCPQSDLSVNFTYAIDCYDPDAEISCGSASSYSMVMEVDNACTDYVGEDTAIRAVIAALFLLGVWSAYRITEQCFMMGGCDEVEYPDADCEAGQGAVAVNVLSESSPSRGSEAAPDQLELADLHDLALHDLNDGDRPSTASFHRIPSPSF